jgi:Rad3-related DNA helicase
VNLQFREGYAPRVGMQSDALAQLANLDAKYILLSLPVGSGKSLIGLAAAVGAESAFIVAPQNILLDQYAREFSDVPMVKGRSHYNCSWAGGRMACDEASETYESEHTKHCANYIPARNDFWGAPVSVTNLHYAAFARCPDEFGNNAHRRLLVVDECHELEPMLLSLFHVKVLRKDAEALEIDFRQKDVEGLFNDYVSRVGRGTEEDDARLKTIVPDIQQRDRMKSTARKLVGIGQQDTANPWHIDRDSDRNVINVRPLFARKMAQRLLGMADRVLFMSGTPGKADNFFRNLGIEPKDTAVVEVDSDFPRGHGVELVKNAPYVTGSNLIATLPILADCCAQAMRESSTSKGLILCASYALQKELAAALATEFGSRLIVSSTGTRTDAVAEHKRRTDPTVLIAVNMHEGLDLSDGLARFLVIPKVLYTARDSWITERERLDSGYYNRLTAARMVQACGRVVRGPTDWARIYILDGNFLGVMKRCPAEFPAYFHRGFHAE